MTIVQKLSLNVLHCNCQLTKKGLITRDPDTQTFSTCVKHNSNVKIQISFNHSLIFQILVTVPDKKSAAACSKSEK